MSGAGALTAEAGYVRIVSAQDIAASHVILRQRALDFNREKAILAGSACAVMPLRRTGWNGRSPPRFH